MKSVAIAIPGSAGPRDVWRYLSGARYVASTEREVQVEKHGGNTLGVVLRASGVPESNQLVLRYPQNLNVARPLFTKGNLVKATSHERNTFYGRSVDIGVRNLHQAVETLAESVGYERVNLLLAGYSQGAEVLQMFLANAAKMLEPPLYAWLSRSLNVAVLLANPVRENGDGTYDYGMNKSMGEPYQDKTENSGSLIRHKFGKPIKLGTDFASRCVNAYWVNDPIASYPESTMGSFKHFQRVVAGGMTTHINYSEALKPLREILGGMGFEADQTPIALRVYGSFTSPYDSDERYKLAKKYFLARAGSGTTMRRAFEEQATTGRHSRVLWERMTLEADQYGILGKLVQAAVWVRITDLLASKVYEAGHYFMVKDELRTYMYTGIVSPYQYLDYLRALGRGREDIVGTSTVATIEAFIGQLNSPKSETAKRVNIQITNVLKSANDLPDDVVPAWVMRWDGNPNTVGVRKFLEEAVESTGQVGNTLKSDIGSVLGKFGKRTRTGKKVSS